LKKIYQMNYNNPGYGMNQNACNQGGFNQGGFNQGEMCNEGMGMNQGGMNQGGMHQHWSRCHFNNPREHQARQFIDQIYMKYDRDCSGSLDQNEFPMAFNEVMMLMGMPGNMGPQEVWEAMAQLDRNRDGRIERPEFYALIQNMMNRY
jgi:hypothetical protein